MRRAATRMFGRFPSVRVHPDHAVALGAAIQAGLREKNAALKEIRLTDVCPFTLGVESAERTAAGGVRGGLFSPIIERNTVVPASRAETFRTMSNGQREVEIAIYQGESRLVAENVALGKLHIPVPPRRAGEIEVVCRFSYDASGLLEVDVSVPATGTSRQLVLLDEEEGHDAAETERVRGELARLKLHPREDAPNAAMLARARRAYEAHIGDSRSLIAELLSRYEAALDTQDPRRAAEARDEIGRALDALEGEVYL